jgi:hypothetical protein
MGTAKSHVNSPQSADERGDLIYDTNLNRAVYVSLGPNGLAPAGDAVAAWVTRYVQCGALFLPEGREPYGSVNELVAGVRAFIHSHFDVPETFESVAVLYVLFTWLYDCLTALPYLRLFGSTPGSGKTRGTETIGALCYRAFRISGAATPAVLFRMIEDLRGTLLLDEADFKDSQIGADISKVLNQGYKAGWPVVRMDKNEAGKFEPRTYQVYSPKIINGRKRLEDDATEDRCLTCTPLVTDRQDIPALLGRSFHDAARTLQNKLLQFRLDYRAKFHCLKFRTTMSGRTLEILLGLLSIVELLEEPERSRYSHDLEAFAGQRTEQVAENRKATLQALVLQAVLSLKPEEPMTCMNIASSVVALGRDDDPDIEKLATPRRIGAVLNQLGFRTRHTRAGNVLIADAERLDRLAREYGLERSPQCSQTDSNLH